MSKFKTMIRNDIAKCDEFIEKGFAKHSDVQAFVGKYIIDYPNFENSIIQYASVPGHETNEIENIKIIKSKLEYLLGRVDNPELYSKKTTGINISNYNNNENSNSNEINVSLSIPEIKEKIDNNTMIGDQEKKELLEKLDEIQELQQSGKSKNEKWKVAKGILAFIIDKGADIAIMFLPQILNAIK